MPAGAVTVSRPDSPPRRSPTAAVGRGDPPAARRTWVRLWMVVARRRAATRPSDRTPRPPRRRAHAAGGGDGCAPSRGRTTARRRSRRATAMRRGRRGICTTAPCLGTIVRGAQARRRRACRGSARSSGESRPALETPGLDDRSAGAGAHPGAKAVLTGSSAGVGLVGALHGELSVSLVRVSVGRARGGAPVEHAKARASPVNPTTRARRAVPDGPLGVVQRCSTLTNPHDARG